MKESIPNIWRCVNCNTEQYSDSVLKIPKDAPKPIDWQAFRAEAAKDAMCAMINSCSTDGIFPDPDEVSGMAVLYADNLIAKLK